jgi:hypothetical protein
LGGASIFTFGSIRFLKTVCSGYILACTRGVSFVNVSFFYLKLLNIDLELFTF